MTIDEAIEQFKYDAECNRADLDISYAEENEQVAEWLEELKSYRAIGTVEECRENKEFLEFLYNIINPNDMEQYLLMYHGLNEKSK